MVINSKNVREIHKELFRMTISEPRLYPAMEKIANRAKKTVDRRKTQDENAIILLTLFNKNRYNSKIKALINHNLMEEAEDKKHVVIKKYVKDSRDLGRWIYLASSHDDCAVDHLPYQGKLYFDNNAPTEIQDYAKKHGYRSIQWVMSKPAWFITRPNCRHFFKALPLDAVKKYSLKELQRRYKTHRKTGDKALQTQKGVTLEEYEDRLRLLKALYQEHKTERLRREILKTELLIKKWKKIL